MDESRRDVTWSTEGHGSPSCRERHCAAFERTPRAPGGESFYIKATSAQRTVGAAPAIGFKSVTLSRAGRTRTTSRRAESIVKRTATFRRT